MASKNVSKPARTTPAVRCSYPTLFNPRAFQAGQTPKFSITLMFDKTDKEHLAYLGEIRKDMEEALAEKWPDATKRPRTPLVGSWESPIKDGDKAVNKQGIPYVETNPEYAGHYLLRASTTQRPIVVDRNKAEIMDTNEIYGGCFVKVNLNAYTFEQPTNKGLTFGLNGVQKWADGESFGGRRPELDEMFDGDTGGGVDPFASSDLLSSGDDIPF